MHVVTHRWVCCKGGKNMACKYARWHKRWIVWQPLKTHWDAFVIVRMRECVWMLKMQHNFFIAHCVVYCAANCFLIDLVGMCAGHLFLCMHILRSIFLLLLLLLFFQRIISFYFDDNVCSSCGCAVCSVCVASCAVTLHQCHKISLVLLPSFLVHSLHLLVLLSTSLPRLFPQPYCECILLWAVIVVGTQCTTHTHIQRTSKSLYIICYKNFCDWFSPLVVIMLQKSDTNHIKKTSILEK